jgi:hypothetical protein
LSCARLRLLPSIVALVAAAAQLVLANEQVFAGTLPLVSRSHGHGHPVTVLAHESHVDVVLHHEAEAGAAGTSLDAGPVHGGDHVLHMASAEASTKRWQDASPAAVAPACGNAPAAALPRAQPRAPDAHSLAIGLRSTVLRI